MRPLRDHILVRPDPLASHVTTTALILKVREGITSSREQFGRTGTVVAVGPGKPAARIAGVKHEARVMSLQPGDNVMFGEWEYPRVDDLLVLQEADVVGAVEI